MVLRRRLAVVPLVLGVLYTLGLVVFAYRYATFVGDDLSTFYALRTQPFGTYLIGLLGGQLVVLHRLVTYVLYRVATMHFLPAVLILGALHLTGAAYMYRTLETMRPSRVNAVLIAYYLMSVFVGIQLTWWSSGLTRVGYIACAAVAIFHYVRHARTGENRELVLVLVAGLAAFGFYAKALLIPLYCAAVDLVSGVEKTRLDRRKWLLRLGTLAVLLAFGVVYSVISRALLPVALRRLNTNFAFQGLFVTACFEIFVGSLADRALWLFERPPLWFIAVAVAFVVYSSARSRRALLAWALAAALVVVNFLLVGLSSRTLVFPIETAVEYRHYFELLFFLVLLVGTVLHRLQDTPEGRFIAARDPRWTSAAMLAVLALHGYSSARTLRHVLRVNPLYAHMPGCRSYLDNLRADLSALERKGGATPAFADGVFPPELALLDFSFRNYSQLFLVLGAETRFVPLREARYAVAPDGHVVRMQRGHIVP